jgi:hypothetical protein
LSAPVQIFGAAVADEAGQRVNGRKALIAAGYSAFALFFDVPQKGAQQVGIDVDHEQFIDFLS